MQEKRRRTDFDLKSNSPNLKGGETKLENVDLEHVSKSPSGGAAGIAGRRGPQLSFLGWRELIMDSVLCCVLQRS